MVACTNIPRTGTALPAGSWRLGRLQRAVGPTWPASCRSTPLLGCWDLALPPSRDPRDRPRWRRKRGGCAATLRAAGCGQRFPRTPPELTEAPAPPAVAGTRTQRLKPSVSAGQPAATAASQAGLDSDSVAVLCRPHICESAPKWLRRVGIDQAARLVQHAAVTVV
jgi:hypothetical protein